MKFFLKSTQILMAAAVLFTAAACSDDDEDFPPTPPQPANTSRKATATNRIEVPQRLAANLFVSHWTVENGDSVMNYCYEFDRSKYHTRWVAYRFDAVTRQSHTGRTNAWADDTELPPSLRIGTNGFGNGYDRGHICPSADRVYSVEANAQTFFMSNMSPQLGRQFNQSIWATFESYVRDHFGSGGKAADFADTLYVVKGGTVNLLNGYVQRPAGMKVAVPKYYFCALLGVKGGAYKAIGFLFEHRNYSTEEAAVAKTTFKPYAMSIDELEQKTGIDFFHNLPDRIETAVEATYSPSAWKL